MHIHIMVKDQIYIKENVYDENNNRKNIEDNSKFFHRDSNHYLN